MGQRIFTSRKGSKNSRLVATNVGQFGRVHLFGQKLGQERSARCADLRRGNSLSYCRGTKRGHWDVVVCYPTVT